MHLRKGGKNKKMKEKKRQKWPLRRKVSGKEIGEPHINFDNTKIIY